MEEQNMLVLPTIWSTTGTTEKPLGVFSLSLPTLSCYQQVASPLTTESSLSAPFSFSPSL